MFRTLLFLILLSAFYPSIGQTKKWEESIGWSGNDLELHSLSDKAGQTHCFFLVNEDSIRGLVVDGQQVIIRQFQLGHLNREKLLGGYIKEGKVYVFLEHRFPASLHNYTIDIATGNLSENFVQTNFEHEKVIGRFNAGDHFLYFTLNKKTSDFIVYAWRDAQNVDTLQYHFADEEVWHDLSVSENFYRYVHVAWMDEAGDPEAETASIFNKIYLNGDSLILIMNKNNGLSKVYTFDTKAKRVTYREIAHNKIGEQKLVQAGYVDNTFLRGNKLYFVSASEDRLVVQVLDFYNGKILRKFTTEREDSITFKNTPIFQDGPVPILYFTFHNTKQLEKTGQLLRKMVGATAVISATDDSAGIAITVGSFKQVTYANSGGGSWMSTGGGGGSPPTMTYVPSGSFSRTTLTKVTHFRMSIDKQTLEHIPGEMQPSINDRIDDYTAGIKIPPNAENLLNVPGGYLYIYYDRKMRKLVLTQF